MPETNNLNYYYSIEYYNKINWNNVQAASFSNENKELCKFRHIRIKDSFPDGYNINSFTLKTVYPGLITGTGTPHQVGGKEESAFGFSFDYVTGMPYIPGSTVKGLLRSAFEIAGGEYIVEKLNELDVKLDRSEIDKLECSIFGPHLNDHDSEANGTDIFLDSFIVGTAEENGTFLEIDSITPHSKPSNDDNAESSIPPEMIGPNPISFIKIKPNVGFNFRFILKDHSESITAEIKLKLFKSIMLDLGIGAKTNVGYGALAVAADGDFYTGEYRDSSSVQSGNTDNTPGKCLKCGKTTAINKKTGKPYPYCFDCKNIMDKQNGFDKTKNNSYYMKRK